MLMRAALLRMADSPQLRGLVETRGWRLASRFVAGRTLDESLQVVRRLAAGGIRSTLSHLGEHTTDAHRARAEAEVYRRAAEALARESLPCGLSIKPTQVGLSIAPALARSVLCETLEVAAAQGRFVRLDMEGSDTTDATLAMARSLHREYPRIGVVIQAYLRRSRADVNALNEEGIPVRLCKGAYMEPPEAAYPDKPEVDQNFYVLMKMLLHSGARPAIATHDERLITAAMRIAGEELPAVDRVSPRPNADRRMWEFQMLYGVRRDLQARLAGSGYGIRVYVPFGTEWYPYFMRRLAERPANLAFVLRALRKG